MAYFIMLVDEGLPVRKKGKSWVQSVWGRMIGKEMVGKNGGG
jgi:hypothetical protein